MQGVRDKIGMVFQEGALFDLLSVYFAPKRANRKFYKIHARERE